MKHILLLHGALGSKDQFNELAAALKNDHIVHLFNFSGHGGDQFHNEFSIPLFANEVVRFLNDTRIESSSIFGYSMGGYVGMYVAKHFPQRIEKLITLATKFRWDETIASREIKFLDADALEKKVPAFAEELQRRHAPGNWKDVLDRTKHMLLKLGEKNAISLEEYKDILTPSLLLLGDRDKMVSLEETVEVFKELHNGQLGILPATPHPFEQVNMQLLRTLINRFIYQPIP
jgi:pimeloyl-ACP methyl ester carboxylesterase